MKLPVYPFREYFHDESSFCTDMDEAVSNELKSEIRMLTSKAYTSKSALNHSHVSQWTSRLYPCRIAWGTLSKAISKFLQAT